MCCWRCTVSDRGRSGIPQKLNDIIRGGRCVEFHDPVLL